VAGLQYRALDVASEVIVAGIAYGSRRQDVLPVAEGLGKDVFDTLTSTGILFAENAPFVH
jgi:hypothetical protein